MDGHDPRVGLMLERLAKLEEREAHTRDIANKASARAEITRKELMESASICGREAAISYEEGLKHSFIKDMTRRLRRVEVVLVVFVVCTAIFASVMGIKLPLLIP